MAPGVNSDVNIQQQPVGIKHNLGKSKVQLPHTVNPEKPSTPVKSKPMTKPTTLVKDTGNDNDGFRSKHELNLALIIVCVGVLAYYMSSHVFR